MLKNFYLKIKNYKDWHVVILSIWCLITFFLMFNHNPWYDEAHAWMLAKFMNFDNWVQILKEEGHPILWFLVIKPFTYIKNIYPYPMLIANWVFCFLALIVMWKKAPFSRILKTLITFSPLFVIYFPIVARNYSIGLLGVFLLAAFYKTCTQKPLLYATIIGLTLNTHLIIGIAASWFGLVFAIKLFLEKLNTRDKILSLTILLGFGGFFIFPYIGGYGTESIATNVAPSLKRLMSFFLDNNLLLSSFLGILAYIFIKKDWLAKSFIIYTFTLLLILFGCFYSGFAHHFIFFFIYLIIPFWISSQQDLKLKEKISFILIGIIFYLFPYIDKLQACYGYDLYKTAPILNGIRELVDLNSSVLYLSPAHYPIFPYLYDDYGKNLYELCNKKNIDRKTELFCKNPDNYSEAELLKDKTEAYVLIFEHMKKPDGDILFKYRDTVLYHIKK